MRRLFKIKTQSIFIAIMVLYCSSNFLYAQHDYKNNPEWINMIGDPNANYFEAIKAYETYWKYHEKPNGEEEEMEMGNAPSEKMTEREKKERDEYLKEKEKEREKEMNKKFTEKDMKALEEKQNMIYQCKRFEDWIHEVKPFVQEDGRILSPEERMKIYNDQIEEQRKQDKK